MPRRVVTTALQTIRARRGAAAAFFVAAALAACGGGASGSSSSDGSFEPPPVNPSPRVQEAECSDSFDGTFAAIQEVVFERRGCTNDLCHGASASGGLDLRAAVAWQNLFDVPATGSELRRIVPGSANVSYLYLKLLAAKGSPLPGGRTLSGQPMPSGLPPISDDELEAVRKWIEVGASRTGTVGDNIDGSSSSIGDLLGACLPDATPISVEPLGAPDPAEGVQIEMPPYLLKAASEVEVCFASYFDFTDLVPDEYKTPDGESFYVNTTEVRQDPHSHHFVPGYSGLGAEFLDHPSFGTWSCRGGPRPGEACDPKEAASCEGGLCASEPKGSVACIGYGPPETRIDVATDFFGGPSRDGYYAVRPLKGILYWNLHAFNLQKQDHEMHSRVNLYFARDRRLRAVLATDSSNIYVQAGQPPYTEKTYCATHVVPRGVEMFRLTAHTHKHGRRFWVLDPDGEKIYESFVYSDPVLQDYDPPLVYDSPDPAERTLTYCAVFNNGLDEEGNPDPHTVSRLSRMPERTSCEPVACTAGRVGAPCRVATAAACDSSPAAGDGVCDACKLTAGITTGNEMLILIPYYGVPD